MNGRFTILKNTAMLLNDGDYVNLGVGLPSGVSQFIPPDRAVFLHAENGLLGEKTVIPVENDVRDAWERAHHGPDDSWRTGHKDLMNAGCRFVTTVPGACCFDSATAFIMARGGHLDATVLGGLQVDAHGNLANWMVPGRSIPGMGGAMDLVSGARRVIVAMEHCTKNGSPKLLGECTYPLTAIGCVDTVVTDFCIIHVEDAGFLVTAMLPGLSRGELEAKTGAPLRYAAHVEKMYTAE